MSSLPVYSIIFSGDIGPPVSDERSGEEFLRANFLCPLSENLPTTVSMGAPFLS